MQYIWFISLLAVISAGKLEDSDAGNDEKVSCDTMFCALGQECIEKDGEAECLCIKKCVAAEPVCGSNGTHTKTYPSKCHLYREACLHQDKEPITLVALKTCEEEKMIEKDETEKIEKDVTKPKPVVCMQKDRDAIRSRIINLIKKELNMEFDTISYKGILLKFFQSLDINNDGALDTAEFLKILKKEMSLEEILSADKHTSAILRELCMSELIQLTDYNADYKLEFDEFHDCLSPGYEPPKESCECDGKIYEDGDDIRKDCNTCKCACGHWVCTSFKCEEKDDNSVPSQISMV